LRSGVWLRPDNLPAAAVPAPVAEQCAFFVGRPDEAGDLDVAALFAVHEWAATAHELLGGLAATHGWLRDRDAEALGETFVIAAATTRHLTLDPLLPKQLLPADWPGSALRQSYDTYQRDFARTWRAWYRSTLA
ncbi:MAG: PaaX domain-containing protein, C- domain protein, partial [Actinobacteria bacterium]|nr:PaaX domain-containing protein, C- domain protein [Actinomycetota bacterium]